VRASRWAWLASLALSTASHAAEPPVPPDNPLVFVADPNLSMEPGVRTINSLGRVVFLYDDALAAAVDVDETKPGGKALGITGRVAKGALVDVPLLFLQGAFVHEVFGHGARARELRLSPTYSFRLVPPYRGLLSDYEPDPAVATTFLERSGVADEDLAVTFAGIEATSTSAWWLQVGMVQRAGWMHYRDLLQYVVFRLDYVGSLVLDLGEPPSDPATAHDIQGYVSALQVRYNVWRPAERRAIARNLRSGYLLGLVDPMLWLSSTHAVVTYGVKGQRHARLPLIDVGPWGLFPTTRYALTPFGPEHGVELLALRDDVVYDVYVRGATGGLVSAVGVGGRVMGVPVGDRGRLGAEVDLWRQPDLMFERVHLFDRPQQPGALAGVHLDWRVHRQLGVVGRLAYKTEGYVRAQPLAAGPTGYLGLSITPEARP